MTDLLLSFLDVFWKVALALALLAALRKIYAYRRKITKDQIKEGLRLLFYCLVCVLIYWTAVTFGKPPVERRDLLESRYVAAQNKFSLCWSERPEIEERNKSDMLSYIADFKRLGCPEFLLYLDDCDELCKEKAVRIIRRSFVMDNAEE